MKAEKCGDKELKKKNFQKKIHAILQKDFFL
jgi:hypothetical protein